MTLPGRSVIRDHEQNVRFVIPYSSTAPAAAQIDTLVFEWRDAHGGAACCSKRRDSLGLSVRS
jgi:hypothetical protein